LWSTLSTVPVDTPALAAISLMVIISFAISQDFVAKVRIKSDLANKLQNNLGEIVNVCFS
jgi:hypothetical protein